MFANLSVDMNGIVEAVGNGINYFSEGVKQGIDEMYDAVQGNIVSKTYMQMATPALALKTTTELAMSARMWWLGAGLLNPGVACTMLALTALHADLAFNAFGLHEQCEEPEIKPVATKSELTQLKRQYNTKRIG